MFDFNEAEISQPQMSIIPVGTVALCSVEIKPGGHDDYARGYTSGLAKETTNAVFLEIKLKVMSGPYENRVFFDSIPLYSKSQDEQRAKNYENMGRGRAKAILCSHYGIDPRNPSPQQKELLKLKTLAELHGKEIVVKVGARKGTDGVERNQIMAILTPMDGKYSEHKDVAPVTVDSAMGGDSVPF